MIKSRFLKNHRGPLRLTYQSSCQKDHFFQKDKEHLLLCLENNTSHHDVTKQARQPFSQIVCKERQQTLPQRIDYKKARVIVQKTDSERQQKNLQDEGFGGIYDTGPNLQERYFPQTSIAGDSQTRRSDSLKYRARRSPEKSLQKSKWQARETSFLEKNLKEHPRIAPKSKPPYGLQRHHESPFLKGDFEHASEPPLSLLVYPIVLSKPRKGRS